MTTAQVNYTVPSDGWTGAVDVTAANLDADNSTLDIVVYYDSVLQDSTETANWAKSVAGTTLTYSGSALNTDDLVWIRRKTPNEAVQEVEANTVILSSVWNAEFARQIRWREEYDTFNFEFSTPPAGSISNTTYGVSWAGVTTNGASKNALYNKLEALEDDVTTTVDAAVAALEATLYDSLSKVFEARLSLSATEPFAVGLSSSTLYLHPYKGNVIMLYDTTDTVWEPHEITTPISLALSGLTASLPYDVYVYDNSGTVTLELTAWTDRDTRATALVEQDGVLCKTGSLDRRFIGVLSPTSATTCEITADQDEDDPADLTITYVGLMNYYNQLETSFIKYSSDDQFNFGSTQYGVLLNYLDAANSYDTSKYEVVSLGLPESHKSYTYQYNISQRTNSGTGYPHMFVMDNNFANDTGSPGDFDLSPLNPYAIDGYIYTIQTSYGNHYPMRKFGTEDRGLHRLMIGGSVNVAIRLTQFYVAVTMKI